MYIKWFIAVTFWRIPESDSLVDIFFNYNDIDKFSFKLIDNCGNKAPTEVLLKLIADKNFRKLYRSFYLPLLTFKIFFKESEISNWHYYTSENDYPHLCCDNPIIFKNIDGFFNFEDDVIFPLTKKITIIFTRNSNPILSSEFNLDFDLLLFAQANKYVCSSSKEYLQAISDLYYTHYQNYTINDLKNELFFHLTKS